MISLFLVLLADACVALLMLFTAKNCYRIARMRGEKSLLHSYIGRKLKKRDARSSWIQHINASVRQYHIQYGTFVNGLVHHRVQSTINRKMLSELAINEPFSFKAIVDTVKTHAEVADKYYHNNGLVQSVLVRNYVESSSVALARKLVTVKGRYAQRAIDAEERAATKAAAATTATN